VREVTKGVESKLRMNEAERTVLLVDDDPQIIRLLEKMLRARKVELVSAPRPSDALAICQLRPIDLLISDMAMPEMDGVKLAERVMKLHPGARVLLISGSAKEPSLTKNSQVKFLRKPFFPSQLLDYLHELLPEV